MSLDNIRVVLVNPLYGGNVGSVCRAMANMAISDLALVGPERLNMDEARMMACHATDILDNRTEFETLHSAVSDCGVVMGATARKGLYRQHAKSPREWAAKALEAAQCGKVALVFGREDNGLMNDELALCTQIIQIPTCEEYPSINIAQAAMICCYELFVANGEFKAPEEKSPESRSEFRERMFGMWRETLLQIGFMKDDKADHMMLGLRRILSRGTLTEDDVKILMGIARQVSWSASRSNETVLSNGEPVFPRESKEGGI
ncbi:MAG: RNA methyltransferase [Lentisphaerae bacterium]|nr:RNA methyltransferase [Lentisphaerota bacterium]